MSFCKYINKIRQQEKMHIKIAIIFTTASRREKNKFFFVQSALVFVFAMALEIQSFLERKEA